MTDQIRALRESPLTESLLTPQPPVVIDKDVEEGVDKEVDEDVTGDEPSLSVTFFVTKFRSGYPHV
ncbi:hypothetical protein [Streptomyces sp. MMBL 11-3]|uniref:hypothetical protein n=1 Tax=Streptomyces sp. MMBL 11-3 TaxID=3382639 RepID=UPI0039B46A62